MGNTREGGRKSALTWTAAQTNEDLDGTAERVFEKENQILFCPSTPQGDAWGSVTAHHRGKHQRLSPSVLVLSARMDALRCVVHGHPKHDCLPAPLSQCSKQVIPFLSSPCPPSPSISLPRSWPHLGPPRRAPAPRSSCRNRVARGAARPSRPSGQGLGEARGFPGA